jgi:ABC-type transport system substrate-binding protein
MVYETQPKVRLYLSLAMLALAAGLFAAAVAHGSEASAAIRNGGTFRISMVEAGLLLDPALSYDPQGWALLDLTCARLMNYPDRPAPGGFRLVPEVARQHPGVSRDGRTYTFVLRRGFRFSNGAPLTASAFARAIARVRGLSDSPGTQYTRDIAGVRARGNRLVVKANPVCS